MAVVEEDGRVKKNGDGYCGAEFGDEEEESDEDVAEAIVQNTKEESTGAEKG